jgi:hypothetical protein
MLIVYLVEKLAGTVFLRKINVSVNRFGQPFSAQLRLAITNVGSPEMIEHNGRDIRPGCDSFKYHKRMFDIPELKIYPSQGVQKLGIRSKKSLPDDMQSIFKIGPRRKFFSIEISKIIESWKILWI